MSLLSLEPEGKEYRENYELDGIYFAVKSNNLKRWILRFKDHNGNWRWAGLGSYSQTTTKIVRKKAQQFIADLQ